MQSKSIDVGGFMPQAEALLARAEKFRKTTLEFGAFGWEFEDRGPNVAALREAARLGMTGIEVDRGLGGLGFGFREKVRVAEILSRSSIGFAFSLINTQNVAARLATIGSQRHRDAYLPDLLAGRRFGGTALTEPGAGSDFAAISTTASRSAGGWVLNGRKAWVTNGAIADVILCYAQTDPDLGRDGIACFVIDGQRDGFTATDAYQLVAGSTVGVAGFSLDDYEAGEEDLIVESGSGFGAALLGVNGARVYVAAMACAAVRTALGHAVEYGSTRESFGRELLQHQGLAWGLADVANRLEAAEALTARAVDRYETLTASAGSTNWPPGGEGDDAARSCALAAANAKKFATEMMEPALLTCMQAMGAEGLRSDHVVGRLLTEGRILGYVDGTTEMQTERVARSLSRYYGAGSTEGVSVAATSAPLSPPSAPTYEDPDPGADTGSENDLPVDADAEGAAGSSPQEEPSQQGHDQFVVDGGRDGRFVDPIATAAPGNAVGFDRDLIGTAPVASTESTTADATRTIEFEPTGTVDVAGPPPSPVPPSPVAPPPGEYFVAGDHPLASAPPLPPESHLSAAPSDSTLETRWTTEGPRPGPPPDPPLPPPPTGEPMAFDTPPPPPPPGPPFSPHPPLPTEPPMPPEPVNAVSSDIAAVPPIPPDVYQAPVTVPAPPPPLPGEEHRIEVDAEHESVPTTPPLPPDSMRQRDH